MPRELTIIIPTFNERDNIAPLIKVLRTALTGIDWSVLFVDDMSFDGTDRVIMESQAVEGRVALLRHRGGRDLSSACIEGLRLSSSPFLAVMDADLQHDENLLAPMLLSLRNGRVDLAVATRYPREGNGQSSPMGIRARTSVLASRICRLLFRCPISDPLSGFFMMSKPFFDRVEKRLHGKGFKLLLDIVTSSKTVDYGEFSYSMRPRYSGKSKMRARVVYELLRMLFTKSSILRPGLFRRGYAKTAYTFHRSDSGYGGGGEDDVLQTSASLKG